ncbi:MAG: sulfur carrier protein ThiS [Terriglobales bacterium]
MIEIEVNGKRHSVAARTLAELLSELQLGADRIAVERNRELVPRRLWAETVLANGDRVEVVQMVGGGSGCERRR